MPSQDNFHFDISLSVLNHLGRNLYRNFITVLGEAISNAWDADAENVYIYIIDDGKSFVIRDDGSGMTAYDFQKKFLTIGYSKRKDLGHVSGRNRPFIGRKGIGKLALLSCANRISIISKTLDTQNVGGVIDDGELSAAIEQDLTPDRYPLKQINTNDFGDFVKDFDKGTIIKFSGLKEGVTGDIEYLRRAIALYFRFSLIDSSFNIFVNDVAISTEDLQMLVNDTQFLWEINSIRDPLLSQIKEVSVRSKTMLDIPNISGFIASVREPKMLKIFGAGEKVGIDLFVNGRLREKDILRHLPSARIPESYMYGQIHYDDLDNGDIDRFTSSREGVVADDELFRELIDIFKQRMPKIIDDWDKWRIELRQDGDSDNPRKSKRDRASANLFNETVNEVKKGSSAAVRNRIDEWFQELSSDAEFNVAAYADCFVSENLVRKYIVYKEMAITAHDHVDRISKRRRDEADKMRKGNLTIGIRTDNADLFYLDTEPLIDIAEPIDRGGADTLHQDEKQFTPIRNAVMHTSLLTNEAKTRMTSIRDNIRGKIKRLISEE